MKLAKYLTPDLVRIGMAAEDKWQAIDELLGLLEERGLVNDAARVRADLVDRERKMSTGLEKGLAIPHAKSDGVNALAVALGLKPEGIEFDSLDGRPARAIFLVVSRKDTAGPHIECLAEISRLYSREQVRRALLSAMTPEQAVRALSVS